MRPLGIDDTFDVEAADRLTAECRYTSNRLKKEIHYNAIRFNRMLEERGGVETAWRLINAIDPSQGFTVLWEHQRLDLSVEALAIQPLYSTLFTASELSAARRRLSDYRCELDAYLAKAAGHPPAWMPPP